MNQTANNKLLSQIRSTLSRYNEPVPKGDFTLSVKAGKVSIAENKPAK